MVINEATNVINNPFMEIYKKKIPVINQKNV